MIVRRVVSKIEKGIKASCTVQLMICPMGKA